MGWLRVNNKRTSKYMDDEEQKTLRRERQEQAVSKMLRQRRVMLDVAIRQIQDLQLPQLKGSEIDRQLTARVQDLVVQTHQQVSNRTLDNYVDAVLTDYQLLKGILNNLFHNRYVTARQYAQMLTHLQDARSQVMEWKRQCQ